MNPTERLDILQRGFDAVASVTADLIEQYGEQPEDPIVGRLLGNVHGIVSRLAFTLGPEGDDTGAVSARDGSVVVFALYQEDEVLAQCEALVQEDSPYRGESLAPGRFESLRAIQALRSLLRRYAAGEFWPA